MSIDKLKKLMLELQPQFVGGIPKDIIDAAWEFGRFKIELMILAELIPEQLIEKLKQGWKLVPPDADEPARLFEQMEKMGAEDEMPLPYHGWPITDEEG